MRPREVRQPTRSHVAEIERVIRPCVEKQSRARDIRQMDPTLEQMADALVESGDYRVTRRVEPRTEYHPADDNPKLIAAVVDVETTGTDTEHDKIIELGVCLFEYGRNDGRIYRVIGSWDWLEDPGMAIPPEITRLTGITDQMVAGHRIDDDAVAGLSAEVVLVIAHHAAFDRGFLERRLARLCHKTLGVQPFGHRLASRGHPVVGARIHRVFPRVLPRRAPGRE